MWRPFAMSLTARHRGALGHTALTPAQRVEPWLKAAQLPGDPTALTNHHPTVRYEARMDLGEQAGLERRHRMRLLVARPPIVSVRPTLNASSR